MQELNGKITGTVNRPNVTLKKQSDKNSQQTLNSTLN